MNVFLSQRSGQFLHGLTKRHCLKYIYSRLNQQKFNVLRRILQNNSFKAEIKFLKNLMADLSQSVEHPCIKRQGAI